MHQKILWTVVGACAWHWNHWDGFGAWMSSADIGKVYLLGFVKWNTCKKLFFWAVQRMLTHPEVDDRACTDCMMVLSLAMCFRFCLHINDGRHTDCKPACERTQDRGRYFSIMQSWAVTSAFSWDGACVLRRWQYVTGWRNPNQVSYWSIRVHSPLWNIWTLYRRAPGAQCMSGALIRASYFYSSAIFSWRCCKRVPYVPRRRVSGSCKTERQIGTFE